MGFVARPSPPALSQRERELQNYGCTMQTVIAVEDLRKAYQPKTRKAPEVKALDGISFGVPRRFQPESLDLIRPKVKPQNVVLKLDLAYWVLHEI